MLTDNMYVDYVANFKHLFVRSHITKWSGYCCTVPACIILQAQLSSLESRKEIYVSLRTAVFFYLACYYNALATSLLCSPSYAECLKGLSLSFLFLDCLLWRNLFVFIHATYYFESSERESNTQTPDTASSLFYLPVAVTSTKAITTNLQFCILASIERFQTKSLLTETGMFTSKHRLKPHR